MGTQEGRGFLHHECFVIPKKISILFWLTVRENSEFFNLNLIDMEITGKVHCFFEQSGTFKNEFKKLGIDAEDYDIQNNFGETDHVVDLFSEIENAHGCKSSIFDNIGGGI